MSEIAEIRQVLQDLIAPDLKALKSELLAQKVSTDQQLSTLRVTLDERFAIAETLAQARQATMDERFASAETLARARQATMDERFATLEALAQARHANVIAKFDAIEKLLDLDKRVQRSKNEMPLHVM